MVKFFLRPPKLLISNKTICLYLFPSSCLGSLPRELLFWKSLSHTWNPVTRPPKFLISQPGHFLSRLKFPRVLSQNPTVRPQARHPTLRNHQQVLRGVPDRQLLACGHNWTHFPQRFVMIFEESRPDFFLRGSRLTPIKGNDHPHTWYSPMVQTMASYSKMGSRSFFQLFGPGGRGGGVAWGCPSTRTITLHPLRCFFLNWYWHQVCVAKCSFSGMVIFFLDWKACSGFLFQATLQKFISSARVSLCGGLDYPRCLPLWSACLNQVFLWHAQIALSASFKVHFFSAFLNYFPAQNNREFQREKCEDKYSRIWKSYFWQIRWFALHLCVCTCVFFHAENKNENPNFQWYENRKVKYRIHLKSMKTYTNISDPSRPVAEPTRCTGLRGVGGARTPMRVARRRDAAHACLSPSCYWHAAQPHYNAEKYCPYKKT